MFLYRSLGALWRMCLRGGFRFLGCWRLVPLCGFPYVERRKVAICRRQVRQVVDAPKTKKPRSLALDPFAIEVLKWHRQQMMATQPPGWEKGIVFPNENGDYYFASLLMKPYKRILAKIGIDKNITNQSMRRTYNNVMRQAGVDRMTLRAMTGHCSEEMTEHYSEATDDEKREAVEKGLAPIFDEVKNETGDSTGDQDNLPEKKKKVGGE